MTLSNALFCGRYLSVHPWTIAISIIDVYAQPSRIEYEPDCKHDLVNFECFIGFRWFAYVD